jgi:hypothetical protein
MRNRWTKQFLVFVLVIALFPGQKVIAQPSHEDITRNDLYVPGEVIVTFTAGLTASAYDISATALAEALDGTVASKNGNSALLSFNPESDVNALVEKISTSKQVEEAQPNYIYWMPEILSQSLGEPLVTDGYQVGTEGGLTKTLSWNEVNGLRRSVKSGTTYKTLPAFPTELGTGREWGWDAVQADLIWTNSNVSPRICLLDTGVDLRHPDLSGKVVNGYDFANSDTNSADDNGHGTHMAGIMVAKANNNTSTTETGIGVSNGTILAVKVLNAQGYGTSFSIAAGIRYCANNSYVKIINMSFGSSAPDALQYNALVYASQKGKLLVAAAGNESTSALVYPAAWADADTLAPYAQPNVLDESLISVAAGRAPSAMGYKIWVDSDGARDMDTTELYSAEQCATGMLFDDGSVLGSNYGSWVSLVAPGEDIYSATPVSYGFYGNYYEGMASGYEYLSGSSAAAAFVSGGAARVWSIMTTQTAAAMKSRLTDPLYSSDLKRAVDPTVANAASGYKNLTNFSFGGNDISYGVPFDSDGDGNADTIMAPFCWPVSGGTFGATQDMTNTRYLNIAAAMERGALYAEVKEATTGLPLMNSIVMAMENTTGTTFVQRARAITTKTSSHVVLINLPIRQDPGSLYRLQVSRTSYTTGSQTFDELTLSQSDPLYRQGQLIYDAYSSISLAPTTAMQVIMDWNNLEQVGSAPLYPNLDMFLLLPDQVDVFGDGKDFIVGSDRLIDYLAMPADPYIDLGTLLDAAVYDPSATTSPYAQLIFDGGSFIESPGLDGEGVWMSPTEFISIKNALSLTVAPYYTPKHAGTYTLMVTDYSNDGWENTLDADGTDFVYPVVRLWAKGRIIASVKLTDASAGCVDGNDLWKVLTINAKVTTEVNTCSTGSEFVSP